MLGILSCYALQLIFLFISRNRSIETLNLPSSSWSTDWRSLEESSKLHIPIHRRLLIALQNGKRWLNPHREGRWGHEAKTWFDNLNQGRYRHVWLPCSNGSRQCSLMMTCITKNATSPRVMTTFLFFLFFLFWSARHQIRWWAECSSFYVARCEIISYWGI